MFNRQKTGSVLCPSCGQLVGVTADRCFHCGRLRPGLFGFALWFRDLGNDMGFAPLVMWSCGALLLAMLVIGREEIESPGLLSLFTPGRKTLFLFGASGALPIFRAGRWWTVLSAPWLHGGVVHLAFNMMAVRSLVPAVSELYGAARTVLIYVAAGAIGALFTSGVAQYLPLLSLIHLGAGMTVGASGATFGLLGALFYYGWRGGNRALREQVIRWTLSGVVFGFVMPNVDNACHLGGLLGGYLAARLLDPLKPERTDHVLAALLCLIASAAALAWSVVDGYRFVQ